MTQRTLAGLLALPLVVGLFLLVLAVPLPYVVFSPGPTVDVLAEDHGKEIVQVDGHPTHRDRGELRMTTIVASPPEAELDLAQLVAAWLSEESAVRPYDSVYQEGMTNAETDLQSSVQMVTSQDAATKVALSALGIDVTRVIEVHNVDDDAPAHGKLEVRDALLRINGEPIKSPRQVSRVVAQTPPGGAVEMVIDRDGKRRTVTMTPEQVEGEPRIGIVLGPGFEFPFGVSVGIPERIGGPSAGLMFSLAIYDTLTPGSLTGGDIVAGTGTMASDGAVGPIGGIQQKIAGARAAKSDLFLVPADNCPEAVAMDTTRMRLARVATFDEARRVVARWAEDHDAKLPSCKENQ